MNENPDTTRPTIDPGERLPHAPCSSVFDRWRCGLADGHAEHHRHVGDGPSAQWSDGITGRRLGDLQRPAAYCLPHQTTDHRENA